jgi:CHAT domain-containing protein
MITAQQAKVQPLGRRMPALGVRRAATMVSPPSVADIARRMIDLGEPPNAEKVGQSALALAWALKDLCYAAWSSEPLRAAKAAEALHTLCTGGASASRTATTHALEIEALAAWTGGIADLTRGQMSQATEQFDHAHALFHGLGQGHHAAQTQVPKIMALSMLSQYDDAVACAERTQSAFIALGDSRGAGKVSLNLGALHVLRGSYAQAARHSREASVFFARVGDHQHSVTADTNMAAALTSLGDFDEALRIYARARMRARTHGFPVLEALVDGSMALLHLARGQYPEALAGFEAARQLNEQLALPQTLAITEKQLADAYLELRLLPEALALYDQVLTRFEGLNMPAEQAWTLAQRGRTQALLAQPALAVTSFERAAALFAGQGCGVGEAAVTLARAELALAGGAPGRAEALARQAAQGFDAAGLAEGRLRADVMRANALLQGGSVEQAQAFFDATLARARELQLLPIEVRCLTGQGLAALAVNDTGVAHAAFSAAVALFEEQRRALPGDELRSAFLTDHLRPYQELLRLTLAAHALAPSSATATQVLQQLDRFRARTLGERLEHHANVADDASTQALRERLNWLHRRVQRMDDDGEPSAAMTQTLRHTERALLEQSRRTRLAAPALDTAPHHGDDLAVRTLQGLLGDDGALVEYGVQDNELFACVITPGSVQIHRRVAAWGEVLDALRAARFQINTLRHGTTLMQKHLDSLTMRTQQRMQRLHALVWAPLKANLSNARKVLIVPHAHLGLLPFAALHDGQASLAQTLQIAVAPSARLALRGLVHTPRAPRQALALGESSRLPHAAQEARRVAALFAQGQAFVGEQASLATLRAHAGHADVIHLACHAQFRSDNPMFSALHLHDAPLTVESVESLKLRAGLVVLSACETGLSDHGHGDERVGLVRAFLVAGSARVLASLWPVDDAVTALFMACFYGHLCRDQGPATALRMAQSDVMREHPHPFYWAAFTLHGGW